jgi:hypothetical protein
MSRVDQTFKLVLVIQHDSRDEARAYLIARLNEWLMKTMHEEEFELPLLFWNLIGEERYLTQVH